MSDRAYGVPALLQQSVSPGLITVYNTRHLKKQILVLSLKV